MLARSKTLFHINELCIFSAYLTFCFKRQNRVTVRYEMSTEQNFTNVTGWGRGRGFQDVLNYETVLNIFAPAL